MVYAKDPATADTLAQYNSCVESCQSPLRRLRLETEYELREFQLNLNECFWMCKSQEVQGVDNMQECVRRCYSIHTDMLNTVDRHLHRVYSE